MNAGIEVVLPGRPNTAADRLRDETAITVRGHVTGAHQSLSLEIADVRELYFEEGELMTSRGAFEPTELEIEAGFGDVVRLYVERRLHPGFIVNGAVAYARSSRAERPTQLVRPCGGEYVSSRIYVIRTADRVRHQRRPSEPSPRLWRCLVAVGHGLPAGSATIDDIRAAARDRGSG